MLTKDICQYIGHSLPIIDLIRLGLVSIQLENFLLKDQEFWQLKCRNYYLSNIDVKDNMWKEYFISNYMKVSIIGESDIDLTGFKFKDISHSLHSLAIDLHDNLWSFGSNREGQLGSGDLFDRSKPVRVGDFKVKQVSVSYNSGFIDMDNNVWTFGDNEYGQLGLGDKEAQNVPTLVEGFKAKSITVGPYCTGIIDMNNRAWLCGCNEYGQLGLGNTIDRFVFTEVKHCKVQQIAIGVDHILLLDMNNNVWACGSNRSGQLGLNSLSRNRTLFVQVPVFSPELVIIACKAQQISAGNAHSVILDMENNVWICGSNYCGQLGLKGWQNRYEFTELKQKAKQISAGNYHTTIIDMENNVWVYGTGEEQVKIKDANSIYVPNVKAQKISSGYGSNAMILI